MILSTLSGFGLFSSRRRGIAPADDLDVALAGAQVGLERKRQRWLLFLIEREEQCLGRIAQTVEIDSSQAAEASISEGGEAGYSFSNRSMTSHGR